MKQTKILISTHSATLHTGLAETCRIVFKRLLEKYPGLYDIHQLGWFHVGGVEKVPWPIYPTNFIKEGTKAKIDDSDKYGQRTFESIRHKINPDIVWTNGDLWCFDHILNSPTRNTFRMIAYYTIDGAPYWGPNITFDVGSEWGAKLAHADRIAVLTEWGEKVLHESCPELKNRKIDVIYHPSDIDRFKVLNPEQKKEIRKEMYSPNIPTDSFIFGWVGKNQFRKMNFKMWEVMHYLVHGDYIQCKDCEKITVKEYNHATRKSRDLDTLMMYEKGYDYTSCWYCRSSNITSGIPINDMFLWLHMAREEKFWGPDMHAAMWNIEDRIIFSGGLKGPIGYAPDQLAKLISTWDASLYLSGGEGFGVPAYESLMSGVPVVYTNYSSHADFCQHGGYPVRVTYIPEPGTAIQRSIADTGDAIKQCLRAYNNREELQTLGEQGRAFTMTKSVDSIVDTWHNMFQDLMKQDLSSLKGEKIYVQAV